MPLKGTFDTVSLPGVIQLLGDESKTGILRVKKDREEYQIIFLKGNIVYAVKPFRKDVLGEMLLSEGVISKEQLDYCLVVARVKKQALGKVLVEKQLISKKILANYLYRQLEDILYELFLWDEGSFEYTDTQLNLKWLMLVNVNTVKLIMNAARRVDEVLETRKTAAVKPKSCAL